MLKTAKKSPIRMEVSAVTQPNAAALHRWATSFAHFGIAITLMLFVGSNAAQPPDAPTATAPVLSIVERILPSDCWGARPSGARVDVAVIHFSSAAGTKPDNPYDPEAVIEVFKAAKVSAHFLIDRSGKVYRLVRESDRAFHAGKGEMPHGPKRKDILNDTSIGIELIGIGTFTEAKSILGNEYTEVAYNALVEKHGRGFTDNQYASLRTLIDKLRSNPAGKAIELDRRHIIGHSEYARPGTRNDPKCDPGDLFDWNRLGLSPSAPG